MIYFIRYGSRRLVKIGYSRDHPRNRLTNMQTGTPERLRLLGMVAGTKDDEAEWHRRFAHLRVNGEWFRWTPELRDAVKPYLHDPNSAKARKIEAENGLCSPPRPGTKAWQSRCNALGY